MANLAGPLGSFPQHSDQYHSEGSILLAADQQLGRGPADGDREVWRGVSVPPVTSAEPPPHKVGASSARGGLNHYAGNSVFPESPCFGQERFTEGRYLHTMSPSWALADCPVCGVSFEAVGPDGVLVHLLASHPRSAAARWVDEQLAGSDPVWHGRSGSVRYLRIAEQPEAAGI